MKKMKKGKYSKTSRERQLANKRARGRRYRANQRRLADQRANPDGFMHDGDVGQATSSVTPPDPADVVDAAAETHS